MTKKEKVVVIGAAPDQFVLNYLQSEFLKKTDVFLVIPEHKTDRFATMGLTRIIPFKGMLGPSQIKLLIRLWLIKPDKIILVYGQAWFHQNVVDMMYYLKILHHDFEFIVSESGSSDEYSPISNYPLKRSILLLFLSMVLILCGSGYAGILPETVFMLIYTETMLVFFRQKIAYDQKVNMGMQLEWTGTGRLHTIPHKRYGWINEPGLEGHYINRVTGFSPSEYKWCYTHDNEGLRITQPLQDMKRPVISVIGCSITYGQSINTEETFCWRIQESMKDFRIKNFGVGAYSLYQMYLRLKDSIENDNPKVVVLGFHQELEQRNTNSFKYRMYWMRNFLSPSCMSNGKKLKQYKPAGYVKIPLTGQVKFLELLEYGVNRFKFRGRSGKTLMRKTNEHLLFMIRDLCEKHGAKLMIACIDNSENYYEFFMKNGFSWCITNVTSRDIRKWTMFPFDGHPNGKANQRYADIIEKNLRRVLDNRHVVPDASDVGRFAIREETTDGFIYQHY